MATLEGSLLIVGTGIQAAGQVTVEARAAIERADKLLYVVADPTTEHYLRKLNASAESLHGLYETDKERFVTYMEMVSRIIDEVRKGARVCVAFYGHPGVFTFPSHEAIRQARALGYPARMQPGISAEDCLFADLGIDPSMAGCQSFEATDFLLFRRRFDTNSSLVLWQVGVIGDPTFQGRGYDLSGLRILGDYLIGFYGGQHRAILYEASHYPTYEPTIQPVALADLADAKATAVTTMYVPPKEVTAMDSEMLELLGLDPDVIHKVAITLGSPAAGPPRTADSVATEKKPAFDAAKPLSDPKSVKKRRPKKRIN